jgi:hypothetical protein
MKSNNFQSWGTETGTQDPEGINDPLGIETETPEGPEPPEGIEFLYWVKSKGNPEGEPLFIDSIDPDFLKVRTPGGETRLISQSDLILITNSPSGTQETQDPEGINIPIE